MYEAQELLQQIDDHTAPVLIGFTIAMLCQTVWLVDAIRVAKRDQVYSIPLFCTFLWFAHDLGCVVRFDDWFSGPYDHWFMQAFWVGLLSAVLLELVFIAQILKYGRQELAPTWTQSQFALAVAAGLIGMTLAWQHVLSFYDEPLYFGGTALTMFVYLFLQAAIYHRRGGSAGQTVLMWHGYVGIAAAWWITVGIWFTDEFRSWQYISLGVVCVVGGLVMTRVVARDRAGRGTTPALDPAQVTA